MKALGSVASCSFVAAAAAGCGGGLGRSADRLLGPRGGARGAALRAVHRGDRASTSRSGTATAPSSPRRSPRRARTRPPTSSSRRTPGRSARWSRSWRELPAETLERVDEQFRDADGRWVGTSGRSRVVVYNTDALSEDDVPDSVFDLTDPRWKGRIGIAPTNASFQAFVTAMRLSEGDDATRQWLLDLKANDPKEYENNTR